MAFKRKDPNINPIRIRTKGAVSADSRAVDQGTKRNGTNYLIHVFAPISFAGVPHIWQVFSVLDFFYFFKDNI